MAAAAGASGVQYVTGHRGWAKRLLYDDKGDCAGLEANDGEIHVADVVILCTGANTAALVDAKDEIVARSHCVGVMKLTPGEVEKYQTLPIVDDFEQGLVPVPLAYSFPD